MKVLLYLHFPTVDGGRLGSKISSTITIVKNPAGKGTIVIRKEPENVGKSTDSKTDEPDNDTLTGK